MKIEGMSIDKIVTDIGAAPILKVYDTSPFLRLVNRH